MKLKRLLSIIDRVIKQADARYVECLAKYSELEKKCVGVESENAELRAALEARDAAVAEAIAKYEPAEEPVVVEENPTPAQDEVIEAIIAAPEVPVSADEVTTLGEAEPTPPEVLDTALNAAAEAIVPEEASEPDVAA